MYARSLMLSQKPGVLEAADRALAAAEKLGWVPETIDALITKGTFLGQLGRLAEARIILEGAIALAEEHDLGRSIARGQGNLGVCPFRSGRCSEPRCRLKRPIEPLNVSAIVSSAVHTPAQMALALARAIGEFEKAEEVLANPLTREQPPAARVLTSQTLS